MKLKSEFSGSHRPRGSPSGQGAFASAIATACLGVPGSAVAEAARGQDTWSCCWSRANELMQIR